MVAYELAAGRRPYDIHGNTPNKEVRLKHLSSTPKWPSSWPQDFTQLVKEVGNILENKALSLVTFTFHASTFKQCWRLSKHVT